MIQKQKDSSIQSVNFKIYPYNDTFPTIVFPT